MSMVKPLEELVEAFARLPTIGRKSAWRLALYLVERSDDEVRNLAHCIGSLKERVMICRRCYNYSEGELCAICSSSTRDQSIICVVERPVDIFTIERSGRYRGVYHVLGGVLSPIDGVTADKLRITELLHRVETEKPVEIILGLGASADAETTMLYLAKRLAATGVRVTRFARGLPAGMELEYVDQVTLAQAMNERTDLRYGEIKENE
ncbi:MAG: recombination protein RecR [Chitinivibrionales bacterium]|nr:recombination protein RecR [Chitinivibrionales bacterium]MBD3358864.1 recombination protein RecR [Chitinivibrionales bacterium]